MRIYSIYSPLNLIDKLLIMEEKLALLKQLYQMTQADHKIKPVEYSFLYELALSMEVPLEKLEDLFETEKHYLLPKDIQQKIIQIYRLALMMKVDKEVVEEEINTLKSLALQMGLRPESVQNMLEELEKKSTLTFDELMSIFNVQDN